MNNIENNTNTDTMNTILEILKGSSPDVIMVHEFNKNATGENIISAN